MPSRKSHSSVAAPKQVTWLLKQPDEALHIILGALRPVTAVENIPLAESVDRILARDVHSPATLPPVNRSERDGYALRSADCARAGMTLRQIGQATAGSPFRGKLASGECIRIATGGVMPKGTDAVVMFEDVKPAADGITISNPVKPWSWVARAGSDVKRGTIILRKGTLIAPPQIAGVAAAGLAALPVLRKPRALVFTTGNEVRRAGEKLNKGDVYDGITAALVGLLRKYGVEAHCRTTVRDTLPAMTRAIEDAAKKFDMIVFTGGTSVGDKDYGRRALDAAGKTLVHGVNIKPGKPLLFGTCGRCAVFGLPGFPTAALLLAYSFVLPGAMKMLGMEGDVVEPCVEGHLEEEVRPDKDKLFLMPVTLTDDGGFLGTFSGSASVSSIAQAQGYVEVPPGTSPIAKGSAVDVRLM